MIHGYAVRSDGVDATPELQGLALAWGIDHRTMTPVPPAGTITLSGSPGGLGNRIINAGIDLSHAALGDLFKSEAGVRRRDPGGSARATVWELQSASRLALTRRDAEAQWSRATPGDHAVAVDFRTQTLQQATWGGQLLAAAVPALATTVADCPAAGLAWHLPLSARWPVQDTGRILYDWFGWVVAAGGTGGLALTPGDLSAALRTAAPDIDEDSLWCEEVGAGVVEAGVRTSLSLDWSKLYADAWPDVDAPPVQDLYLNHGALDLHGSRPAVIPGVPPGSPDPAAWDARAWGLSSTLPTLQMAGWVPTGDYGLALDTRAQHRRVATLRIPGVQPSPAAYAVLRHLVRPGRVVALDIDGDPRGGWSGYGTVALVLFEIRAPAIPQWTVSIVSMSGAVPGRTEWTLGITPLPAPVPGPGVWDRGAWDGAAWWAGLARWDAATWDGPARWADEPRWDRAVWDYDYYPTP